MATSQQRLKRLRDALEDMVGVREPFGFGILRPSPAARVSSDTWKAAEEAVAPHFVHYDRHLRPPPAWLDPAPDRTYCIRWWGDKKGVEAFKEWGRKAYGVLRQQQKLALDLFVPPVRPGWVFTFERPKSQRASGYYWTLNAFAGLAVKNPQLTGTKEHLLLDIPHSQECAVIPTNQIAEQPLVTILFLEIEVDAITLGLRLLDQLMTGELPSLQVDRKNGVIYVKGKPVAVDPLQAQAVALIVVANGGWVSGTKIRERLKLPEDDRIDRTIFGKLPQKVREQIETQKGKGYRFRRS